MKIVINKCFGGFGLSDKAYEYMINTGVPLAEYDQEKMVESALVIYKQDIKYTSMGKYWDTYFRSSTRHSPLLVKVVETLGREASGPYAALAVVEIPDGVEYEINDYDGMEHVAEKHRTWS